MKIESKSQLKELFKSLEAQGFGYFRPEEAHRSKVSKMISDKNKLNVSYHQENLNKSLEKIDNYDDIEKEIETFFSKFSPDDKIKELIQTFSIKEDDYVRTPSNTWPDRKDIIAWVDFKRKFNLKDEFGKGAQVNYYNLDKNYLKINYREYGDYDFKKLYSLIFNESPLEFRGNEVGKWHNLGKIEIKFFLKGGANIKGDLTKFKEYYYNYLINSAWSSRIIKYKGKYNIIVNKNHD